MTEADRATRNQHAMNPDVGRTIIFCLCIAAMLLFAWNAYVQWDLVSGERLAQWVGFIVMCAGIATRNAVGLEAIREQPWDVIGQALMIVGLSSIVAVVFLTGLRHTRKNRLL